MHNVFTLFIYLFLSVNVLYNDMCMPHIYYGVNDRG